MGDRRVWWAVHAEWKQPKPFYGTCSRHKVRLLEAHPDAPELDRHVNYRFHRKPGDVLGYWGLGDLAVDETPEKAVQALLASVQKERGWLLEQFREVDAQVSRWAGWLEDQVDADCPGRPEVK